MLRIFIILILTFFSLSLVCQTNSKHVYVKPYTKSNGTHVEGHYRTAPNSTNNDNFSTKGNVNPYTGEPGYIPPDNKSATYPTTSYSTITYPTYSNNKTYNSNSTDYNTFDFKYDLSSSYSSYPSYSTLNIANLRQDMSGTSAIITSIPKGETVKIVNSSWGDWWEVYYNKQTGYIHRTSLAFYSSGTATSNFYNYDSYPSYQTKIKLNMRTDMNSASAIQAIIPKDEIVRVLTSAWGNWWEVYYNGYTGYVQGMSMAFYSAGNPSSYINYDSYPTYKTKTIANLRQEMSSTSAIKFIIPKDGTVKVINSSWGNWWEIYYEGYTGYVYSLSLTK